MIYGTASVSRVVEESVCRSSKDYRFTDIGVYKIHSNALMPNIPFGEAEITTEQIDKTIFANDEETQIDVADTLRVQNFLSTRYIGRAPLEFYNDGQFTNLGRQFVLICRGGNPNEEYRAFGTEAAIRGYNKDASDTVNLPGGGEQSE